MQSLRGVAERTSSHIGIMGRNIMTWPLILIIFKDITALSLDGKWYEFESNLTMNCKGSGFDGISIGRCAILASTTPIYNFGFSISEGTCMLCRTLGDDTVESIITGPVHVDGKVLFGHGAHLRSCQTSNGCYCQMEYLYFASKVPCRSSEDIIIRRTEDIFLSNKHENRIRI